jgi:CRISPR-associated endonuclease/helicase Cas3
MLSATLPNSRRAALVKAFAGEFVIPSEIPPYPCLTVVSGGQVRTKAFAAFAPGKRILLEPAPSEATALAVWLRDRIRSGGCAAVVCNTVSRAQQIYEACRQAMPGDAEDGAPAVDLLHSRFPFEEREEREQRTLKRFGKSDDTVVRPTRAVLVATQIIEQSLDIDFDLMVSELPPIDLLFQRAGRLHRHERGLRPTGEMATMGLIETPLKEGAPDFPSGNTKVYEEHILLRTWLTLRDCSELKIPDDIRSRVEAVYTDTGEVPEEPALRSIWETSLEKLKSSRNKDLEQADLRYLPHPDKKIGLDALTDMGRDEDDDLHPFFQALTRLTERSVTVACLFGNGDELFLDRACTRSLSLNNVTMAGAAKILRRSCSISHRRVVFSLEALPVPAAWKKNALLRNCRPLTFDADDCCPVGNYRMRLCPNRGLIVELVEENPS